MRDVTKLKPEELLHAICTEIHFYSASTQFACEVLLSDKQTSFSEKQKELVTLISRKAEGLEKLRQSILDYLQQIQFLSSDFSEVQSDSYQDNDA